MIYTIEALGGYQNVCDCQRAVKAAGLDCNVTVGGLSVYADSGDLTTEQIEVVSAIARQFGGVFQEGCTTMMALSLSAKHWKTDQP